MSASCTVNGVTAIRAHIVRPRIGPWIADVAVSTSDAQSFQGAVTIELPDAGLSFKGDAHRSGVHHETVFLRAVGGAGGLDTVLPPKAYRQASLRIALQDIVAGAGETLSGACDAGVLATILPFWSRPQQTARRALFSLLQAVGSPAWRILPDGTLWVGPEKWDLAQVDFVEFEFEPNLGRLTIAAETPSMAPGQSFAFDGQVYRISTVQHEVDSELLRHVLLFEGATEGDRLKTSINSYVRDLFPRIDLYAGYWCTVASQNSDGSLELKPDDARLAGYSGVPIRYGVPGVSAKVSSGARCLLEFAGGDSTRPMVTAWEPGTALELDLGSPTATDALVKGTTYRTAEDTLFAAFITAFTAINTAFQADTGLAAPAKSTVATALTTTLTAAKAAFSAAAATYLSQIARTA
jgi:hypothetical protein